MTQTPPATDLVLDRVVQCPAEHLWRGWTDPELIVCWFTPAPWVTTEAIVDLRPGGLFRTVMRGPNGEGQEGNGCVLEVEPTRRFTWTSALGPDYRPNALSVGEFAFTATIQLDETPEGTRYLVTARHASEEDARTHAEMGFHAGWGAALDQLIALYQR